MRSHRRVLVLLVALALAGGCGGYVYRPTAGPLHAVTTSAGRFAVAALGTEDAQWATNVTVTLATQGVAPTVVLSGATLTVPAAAPCSAGWGLYQLAVAGAPVWRRPVGLAGDQELRLAFRDAGWVLNEISVVDLALVEGGQPRCVRLNLITRAAGDEWATGPWWLDFRLRSYYPVGQRGAGEGGESGAIGPHHDGHSGMIRLGRFVGPINLGLELEFGVAGCAGTCLPREHYFGLVGMAPSLQGVIVNRGRFVVSLNAAYDFIGLQEQHPEEDEAQPGAAATEKREIYLHGPRLGLGLFYATRPALAGAVRDLRAMYGVELFGGYRRNEAGGAVVVGFSLVLGGPIL